MSVTRPGAAAAPTAAALVLGLLACGRTEIECEWDGHEQTCMTECGAGVRICDGVAYSECSRPCTGACGSAVATCERQRWVCDVPAPSLPAVVRDMTEQHPDFQYPFRPGIEPGIVGPQLDARDKPVYVGGTSGTRTTKGPESFASWFNDVPGINERGRLELRLQVYADRPGRFILEERPFFPIDGQLAGNEGRAHNWHFTIEATTSITYRGGETLSLAADDDLWVFVDRRLVGDLGGTHRDDEVVTVSLDRLGLAPGRMYPMHLFYAERHTVGAALYVDLADHLLECP